MGLLSAAAGAIGGTLADQWLDVIEATEMQEGVVMCKGEQVRRGEKRNTNRKGSSDLITDGSIIYVNQNQFMMLVDGGKIVDYSAEPGYFKVSNNSAPSIFNGQFKDSLKDAWNRFKFSGTPSGKQEVYYINLQEIKGIKFGTPNPLQYFDLFYNSELFLRTFGTYSIKVTDPILFFQEAIPRNTATVHIEDINQQYLNEFLEALQAVVNQMSAEGIRISFLPSKGRELSKFMQETLDEEWKKMRGFEVQAVGISSISYDEESKKLINERNKAAMLSDPNLRETYVQTSIARGFENAGSNEGGGGPMGAFMGMGLGMQAAGGFMQQSSQVNMAQMQQQQAQSAMPVAQNQNAQNQWQCSCGATVTGKFCSSCGSQKPQAAKCANCGAELAANAKFCGECGTKVETEKTCANCNEKLSPGAKFCGNCGQAV
ncbi:MAG: SPFH domain-containing protein [Cardiobacteriaceae bacterium]|nr:SPFH domain-containing protein [Cardiobacteriaceae bacterium]